MEYYMAIKETEILPCAATWMALDIIKQSEVGQKKTNIIWCHLYVEPKKKNTNASIYKSETDSQTWKTNLQLPKGEGSGRRVN